MRLSKTRHPKEIPSIPRRTRRDIPNLNNVNNTRLRAVNVDRAVDHDRGLFSLALNGVNKSYVTTKDASGQLDRGRSPNFRVPHLESRSAARCAPRKQIGLLADCSV